MAAILLDCIRFVYDRSAKFRFRVGWSVVMVSLFVFLCLRERLSISLLLLACSMLLFPLICPPLDCGGSLPHLLAGWLAS